MFRPLSVLVLAVASGCAITPYEQSFQCPLSSDFGACTDVSGAYEDAVAELRPRAAAPDASLTRPIARSRSARRSQDGGPVVQRVAVLMPMAPIVTTPTLVRTWILAYYDSDRSLFAGRYVFYLAGESALTVGSDEVAAAPSEPASAVLPFPPVSR